MIHHLGMELGLAVLIAGIISAGVLGAIIRSWSWHTKLYSLERRVKLMEDHKLSDMQREKSEKRWKQRDLLSEIQEQKQLAPVGPPSSKPWWEP